MMLSDISLAFLELHSLIPIIDKESSIVKELHYHEQLTASSFAICNNEIMDNDRKSRKNIRY